MTATKKAMLDTLNDTIQTLEILKLKISSPPWGDVNAQKYTESGVDLSIKEVIKMKEWLGVKNGN